MTTERGKLVRDNIPEIIASSGKKLEYHNAESSEYRVALERKLLEEVLEYFYSGTLEELAGISEVISAICELEGFDKKQLASLRRKKAKVNGTFSQRIILDRVGF